MVDSHEVNLERTQPIARRGRKRYCRNVLGGQCVRRRKPCPGDLKVQASPGKPFCRSKTHRCCYGKEMTINSEKFLLVHQKMDWDSAKKLCKSGGLQMAEPTTDAVAKALVNATQNEYGNGFFLWFGARADGTAYVWNSGAVLSNTSPLWEEQPSMATLTTDHCLGSNSPTEPFYPDECTLEQYVICE